MGEERNWPAQPFDVCIFFIYKQNPVIFVTVPKINWEQFGKTRHS